MKPSAWRIFRNGRWNYADKPSNRQEERAAWQPLYTDIAVKEELELTKQAKCDLCKNKQ